MKYDKAGTYTIEYKAVDECGNDTVKTRTVNVYQYDTVLYQDGTLIINESDADHEANVALYGAVDVQYAPLDAAHPYEFTAIADRPWNNKARSIKSVKFGSAVKPTSIAYWFQACQNLEEVDFANFDGSEVTTARAFVAGTAIEEITFPSMPKLTNIRFICNGCASLTAVTFEGNGADITDATDAFQACYALLAADLSGLSGEVATCERMFANASGGADMAITTIYATADLDFSRATASNNMFRSDVDLVGAIAFDSSKTDKTHANLQGYFTSK